MAVPNEHLRASDAERQHVIEELRQHAADGRLTMDEFEQRVSEALAATTLGDLEPVLRELPALEREPEAKPQARRQMTMPSARAVLTAVAVVLAVAMVTQGMWWIIFPLMAVFGGCGGGRRACTTGHVSRDRTWDATKADERELIRV